MSAQYAADPYPGLLLADRFRLLRQLAVGGMGAVWVARHERLGKEVAVKLIAAKLLPSAETRARFEREARLVGQLNSRHVVQIFDCGAEGGLPYIAMELLEGEDLHARLRRRGRLGLQETAAIARQIAKGLRKAHEAGIVHRDLKPANVFLARIDDEEVVKLLDFGVAKFAQGAGDGNATTTGVVVGSPNFMSPEQTRSAKDIDWRSDLWSLGVILYRCITGIAPFRGDSATDVLVKICTQAAPSVCQFQPALPASLDGFFARALARDLEQRFQSAIELADAFDHVVADALATGWIAPQGPTAPMPSPSGPGGGPPLWSSPGSGSLGSPDSPAGAWPAGSAPGPGGAPSGSGLTPASGAQASGGSWPQASWSQPATPSPAAEPGAAGSPSNPGASSRFGAVGTRETARRRAIVRWGVAMAGLLAVACLGVLGWRLRAHSMGDTALPSDGSSAAVEDGSAPAWRDAAATGAAAGASEPSTAASPGASREDAGAAPTGPAPSAEATSSTSRAPASASAASTASARLPKGRNPATPSWGF